MTNTNKQFKTMFKEKFRDMRDILLQRFEVGIVQNESKAIFTEDEIDHAIKFYSYAYGDENNRTQFAHVLYNLEDIEPTVQQISLGRLLSSYSLLL